MNAIASNALAQFLASYGLSYILEKKIEPAVSDLRQAGGEPLTVPLSHAFQR